MKRSPLFCVVGWLNIGTGNITLELNREPAPQDKIGMRKNFEAFLSTDGAGFFLHVDKTRVLLEPTSPTRHAFDIDESFVRDMLRRLSLGNDVPLRRKFVSGDTLNPGAKRRFTPIPAERLSML